MASNPRKPIDERVVEVNGSEYKVEVWPAGYMLGLRVIVTGPRPGRHTFSSFGCPQNGGRVDWGAINAELRRVVATMSKEKFERWYGPKGMYTLAGRKKKDA